MLDKLLEKREALVKEISDLKEELTLKIVKANLLDELIDELDQPAQPVEEVQPNEEAVEVNPVI